MACWGLPSLSIMIYLLTYWYHAALWDSAKLSLFLKLRCTPGRFTFAPPLCDVDFNLYNSLTIKSHCSPDKGINNCDVWVQTQVVKALIIVLISVLDWSNGLFNKQRESRDTWIGMGMSNDAYNWSFSFVFFKLCWRILIQKEMLFCDENSIEWLLILTGTNNHSTVTIMGCLLDIIFYICKLAHTLLG